MKIILAVTFVFFTLGFSTLSNSDTLRSSFNALYSEPLPPLFTDYGVHCMIINTSTRERQVVTEMVSTLNASTGELELIEYDEILLKPGSSRLVSASCDGGCGVVYCKFSVQGSKRLFRASACIEESDTAEMICITAD